MRRAAVKGLGLFVDDAARAVGILSSRLSAESGSVQRLLVVETMARPALRLPEARAAATAWLHGLAGDTSADSDIRLAALIHHAGCVPEAIGEGTVPTAIDLLRRVTPASQTKTKAGEKACRGASDACACAPAADTASPEVPQQITAAFADMERHNRVHTPTTSLLRTFHKVLDHRLPERTALLTEQFRCPDPATRYDAIRMAQDLIGSWRGDHAHLVMLIAECLLPEDPVHSRRGGGGPRIARPCKRRGPRGSRRLRRRTSGPHTDRMCGRHRTNRCAAPTRSPSWRWHASMTRARFLGC